MDVSEQIIDVLDYLGEKFGVVINWNSDTLLPILQNLGYKYIRWEIATSIAWLAIGVIFLIVGFVALRKNVIHFPSYRCLNMPDDWQQPCSKDSKTNIRRVCSNGGM